MGRGARLQQALLRQRIEDVRRNNIRVKARDAARTARLAKMHLRDERALQAHKAWATKPRNLSHMQRETLPVRIYKQQGFSRAQIAQLRDPHQLFSSPRVDTSGPISNLACLVSALFYGLLLLVCIAGGAPGSNSAAVDIVALFAVGTAAQAVDFNTASWFRELAYPAYIKEGYEPGAYPQDSDSDQGPVQRGRTRGIKRTVPDDDDDEQEDEQPRKRRGEGTGKGSKDTDGDGDSPNPPAKPVSKPAAVGKQKAKSRKKVALEVPDSAPSSEYDEEVFDFASELLQANDPALRNARRIATHLKEARLRKPVKPVFPNEELEVSMPQVLQRSRVPGRDIQPLSRRNHTTKEVSTWAFRFRDATHPNAAREEPDTVITVAEGMLSMETSAADLSLVHQELANVYNTWPWPINKVDYLIKAQWVAIALSKCFSRDVQVNEALSSEAAGMVIRARIRYIDSSTGAKKEVLQSVTATDATMSQVDVPPLPAMNVYRTEKPVRVTRSIPNDPNSPHYLAPLSEKKLGPKSKTSAKSQRLAQDALYWLQLQLQGLCTTESRMTELLTMYRDQIGLKKHADLKHGLFGGESDLYYLSYQRQSLSTQIMPTLRVAENMFFTVETRSRLALKIFSLNASRATPALDTIIQLFCDGRDIRHVWIEAAITADLVNADIAAGVPPSSRCDCDESRTGTERHACEGCGKNKVCNTRSYDSLGRLVCSRCHVRDLNNYNGGRDPDESQVAYLARRSLWASFQRECASRRMDTSTSKVKAIFDKAWKELKLTLPGKGQVSNLTADQLTTYLDEYSKLSFDMGEERVLVGSNPSRRRFHPSGITVDAIQRQGHPSHSGLKHSPGNTAVTSNTCNFAKLVFLVGILEEIARYLRAGDKSTTAKKALVKCMQAMTLVGLKRPYINNGNGSPLEKYDKVLSESVRGMTAADEHGPWEDHAERFFNGNRSRAPRYSPDLKNSIWTDEDWKKTQVCAQSIAKYFGVDLFTLADGTLWIGEDYSNPQDLDRNALAVLLKERLRRMRLYCNKKWQTRDSEHTLYAEVIFQYCASETVMPERAWLKSKYGDRLGLPLVLWLNNPLRFSIAHREHGFGMFTGWISDVPTNVDERITNDSLNNMLIESWFVNSAKFDMAEEYYPELDRILKAINVDKKHYNPEAPELTNAATSTQDDLAIEDVFIGAEFESSAVDEEGVPEVAAAPITAQPGPSKGKGKGKEKEVEMEDEEEAPPNEPGVGADLQNDMGALMQELLDAGKATLLVTDAEVRRAFARLQDIADTNEEMTMENWGQQLAVWGQLVYGEDQE